MAASGTLLIKVLGDVSSFQKAMKSAENVGTVLGAALGKVGIDALRMGSDYHDALETIRTGTGKTGEALAGLEQSFKNVGGSTEHSLDLISQVMTDLTKRTGLTGEALEGMTQRVLDFSDATKTDAVQNVADLTRVFGDWSIATEDQSETMDQLLRASQATGIGMDDLMQTVVQFGAPLRLLGFGFEESIALLGKWEKEGVNTETMLTGLKFSVKTLANEGVPAAAMAETLRQKIEAIGKSTDPVSDAIKLFGLRAGPDLAAAILEGRFSVDDLMEAIENGSETVAQAAADTEKFGDGFAKLKNQIKLAIGPIMQDFAGLTEELGNAVYLIPALGAALGRALGKLWTKLGGSGAIKKAAAFAGAAASAAYSGAMRVADALMSAASAAWGALRNSRAVQAAAGLAGAAAAVAYSGAMKVVEVLSGALTAAWTVLAKLPGVKMIAGAAGAAAAGAYAAGMKVATALAGALQAAWIAVGGSGSVVTLAAGAAGSAAGWAFTAGVLLAALSLPAALVALVNSSEWKGAVRDLTGGIIDPNILDDVWTHIKETSASGGQAAGQAAGTAFGPAFIGPIEQLGPFLDEAGAQLGTVAGGVGVGIGESLVAGVERGADFSELQARIAQHIGDVAYGGGVALTEGIGRGIADGSLDLGSALDELQWILENGLTPDQQATQALGEKWIRHFEAGMNSAIPGAREAAQTVGLEALQALSGVSIGTKESQRIGRIVAELYASGLTNNEILGFLAAEGVGKEALQGLAGVTGWSDAAIDDALAYARGMDSKQGRAGTAGEDLAGAAEDGVSGVSLFDEGAGIGGSLARGLRSKLDAVKGAAGALADAVTSRVRLESPAKEGSWSKAGGPIEWMANAARRMTDAFSENLRVDIPLPGVNVPAMRPALALGGASLGGAAVIENHYHFHGDFFRNPHDYARLGDTIDDSRRHTKRGGRSKGF